MVNVPLVDALVDPLTASESQGPVLVPGQALPYLNQFADANDQPKALQRKSSLAALLAVGESANITRTPYHPNLLSCRSITAL